MTGRTPQGGALEALLARHWWQPRSTLLTQALKPLSWLYAALSAGARVPYRVGWRRPRRAPVPLVVVGNLIAGGAGKTPTVMAVIELLRAAGHRPGMVSRGYGRRGDEVMEVQADSDPLRVGDEPLLVRRRCQVPVWVGRQRVGAARALCSAHPEVDVLVSDDGLQHLDLARDAEVIVFDERGAGNGLLLPAGPLRERLGARPPPAALVLYNATAPTTPWPGAIATRRLGAARPLDAWHAGRADQDRVLSELRGRPLLAVAGVASPERFFAMLEAQGLTIERLPLPDHHDFSILPWPPGTPDVITTEKDAVKLPAHPPGPTRVWVVGLDFRVPEAFATALLQRLNLSSPTPP
jgi:tetraacyldisaccharide 4'-kinase